MILMKRYYYSGNLNDSITLDGDEHRHLNLVMREKKNEDIEIFNGKGDVGVYKIIDITKSFTTLKLINKTKFKKPEFDFILVSAPIKGERQDIVIRQAVEIGVSEIIFLQTEHSEAKIDQKKLEKLERQAVEMCKQCKRAFLPKFSIKKFEDFEPKDNSIVLVGSFMASKHISELSKDDFKDKNIYAVIGPEGGFSKKEECIFSKKEFKKVLLGANTLRADTASAVILGYIKCIKKW